MVSEVTGWMITGEAGEWLSAGVRLAAVLCGATVSLQSHCPDIRKGVTRGVLSDTASTASAFWIETCLVSIYLSVFM